jgi:hypothetical protein
MALAKAAIALKQQELKIQEWEKQQREAAARADAANPLEDARPPELTPEQLVER